MDTRLPLGARLSLDTVRVAAVPAPPTVPVLAALPARERAPAAHLNADLIASLPRGGLDALLPAAGEAVNVAQPRVQDRATLFDAASETLPAWTGGAVRDLRSADIASAIDRAPVVYAPGADVGATIGDTARVRSLVNRARQAGLSGAELSALETRLRGGDFATADALLVGRLLDSPNAAPALRAFLDLASLREQSPKRVTQSVVETLSMGVARSPTDAAEGGEGLLSPAQAHDAAMALAEMSTRDFETIQFALFYASPLFQKNPRADAELQSALALKAVAARRGEFSTGELPLGIKLNRPPSPAAQDVARFIAQTFDVDADVLIARTSGADPIQAWSLSDPA